MHIRPIHTHTLFRRRLFATPTAYPFSILAIDADRNQWLSRHHLSLRNRRIFRGIFDATPTMWAFVIFDGNRPCFESSGAFDESRPIDDAEAFAAGACLQYLFQLLSHLQFDPSKVVILLAGDNQAVLRAYHSCVSSSPSIKSIIDSSGILAFVHLHPAAHIICVDVPKDENYADILTRPNLTYSIEERNFRATSTISRFKLALDIFRRTGKTFIHRLAAVNQINPDISNRPDECPLDQGSSHLHDSL